MPFIIYYDRGMQKTFELLDEKMIVFGREDHAEFQILKDSQISREHFAIRKDDDGKFIIIDLGASNGTFLNDKKLESNSILELKHGDTIKAGRQAFIYRETPLSKNSSTKIMQGVMAEIDNGKSYHTIMCEILGKDKDKNKK